MKNAALMLIICFSLVAVAQADNTVLSSTMWFRGTLTPGSGGSQLGTLAMIDEAAEGQGDMISGFDVYARNGAVAMYDQAGSGTENYLSGAVTGHDAYNGPGGWGSFYTPDCADWNHYQLTLTENKWFLEYTSGGVTYAAPMSGAMNWVTLYASEDDIGSYYAGTGTPEHAGYASNNPYTNQDAGAGYWDMDWSWGSEAIPLEYPGFQMNIIPATGGDVFVTLTPKIPSPGAALLAGIGLGLVGLVRRR